MSEQGGRGAKFVAPAFLFSACQGNRSSNNASAGANYQLCYWLANQGGPANEFQVTWDGTVIRDSIDAQPFPYTETCHDVTASGSTTTVKFGFRQDPSFLWFDDASVAPQ